MAVSCRSNNTLPAMSMAQFLPRRCDKAALWRDEDAQISPSVFLLFVQLIEHKWRYRASPTEGANWLAVVVIEIRVVSRSTRMALRLAVVVIEVSIPILRVCSTRSCQYCDGDKAHRHIEPIIDTAIKKDR